MLTFRFPLWLSLTSYWQTELGRSFSPMRTTTPGVWGNVFPWRLGLQALEKYRTRRQNQVTLPQTLQHVCGQILLLITVAVRS